MTTEQQAVDDEVAEPTPGPWTYSEDFAEVQAEGGSRTLAKMDASDDYSRFSEETHLNGRLMAEAPALSAALAALADATADLLDNVTGADESDPTAIFEAAERALAFAMSVRTRTGK